MSPALARARWGAPRGAVPSGASAAVVTRTGVQALHVLGVRGATGCASPAGCFVTIDVQAFRPAASGSRMGIG